MNSLRIPNRFIASQQQTAPSPTTQDSWVDPFSQLPRQLDRVVGVVNRITGASITAAQVMPLSPEMGGGYIVSYSADQPGNWTLLQDALQRHHKAQAAPRGPSP